MKETKYMWNVGKFASDGLEGPEGAPCQKTEITVIFQSMMIKFCSLITDGGTTPELFDPAKSVRSLSITVLISSSRFFLLYSYWTQLTMTLWDSVWILLKRQELLCVSKLLTNQYGVPRGSILGLLLFNIYLYLFNIVLSLAQITEKNKICYYNCADNTQTYITL